MYGTLEKVTKKRKEKPMRPSSHDIWFKVFGSMVIITILTYIFFIWYSFYQHHKKFKDSVIEITLPDDIKEEAEVTSFDDFFEDPSPKEAKEIKEYLFSIEPPVKTTNKLKR
jgi:hypothetical protein